MKLYKNILPEVERKKLLKFCKTKLEDFGDNWPGLQSKNNLHAYPEMDFFVNSLLNAGIGKLFKENIWVLMKC